MASFFWPPQGSGSGGSGTVTSVGLALPVSVFSISGSPVTISGTLTGAFIVQSANTVFAGPTTGAAATPTFRALVAADIPSLPYLSTTLGTANGLSVSTNTLSLGLSSTSTTGALSSTDWNTFNGKQAAGNYLTALTGDGTASGPGSAALTLATVNVTTGSFGSATSTPNFVVNGKGLITAAASTSIQIAESQVTNLVSDLAGKQATGNYITALTGDVTASGPGSVAATIAAGSVTLVKMANLAANSIIGNNTGSPATPIALTTTQVNTLLGTFANPMTTGGDIIYGGASGLPTRLANGSAGQVLTSAGTTLAPTWSAVPSAAFNVTSQTSNYSANANDYVVCSGASFAVTLPTVVGNSGKSIIIEHNGTSLSQLYTLNTTSGQTVGGLASGVVILFTQGESFTLVADATNTDWKIQDHKTSTGWNTISAPSVTSTSAHIFTITSSSVTAGAIYSNNGSNFTVSLTIAPSTTLTAAGFGSPSASGTLTLVSGTGPGTIAFSSVTNSVPVLGTTTANQYLWRRNGNSAEVQLNIAAGTGTSGSGDYLWDFSAFGSVNTSIVPVSTIPLGNSLTTPAWSQWSWAATGLVQSTSSFGTVSNILFYSPTLFKIQVQGAENGFASNTVNQFALAVGVSARFTVPITGWQP